MPPEGGDIGFGAAGGAGGVAGFIGAGAGGFGAGIAGLAATTGFGAITGFGAATAGFAATGFAAGLRAGALRAAGFFAAVLRTAAFFAGAFRAAAFLAGALRALVFLALVFLAAARPVLRTVRPTLRAVLRTVRAAFLAVLRGLVFLLVVRFFPLALVAMVSLRFCSVAALDRLNGRAYLRESRLHLVQACRPRWRVNLFLSLYADRDRKCQRSGAISHQYRHAERACCTARRPADRLDAIARPLRPQRRGSPRWPCGAGSRDRRSAP